MRIVLHDYAGHPFTFRLSQCLESRGHHVLHQYCASCAGPKASFDVTGHPHLYVDPIVLSKEVVKSKYAEQIKLNFEHGQIAADHISAFHPDVVVMGCTPLEAVDVIQRECWKLSVPNIFWIQDLIAVAAKKIVAPKLPVVGSMIGDAYIRYEQKLAKRADHCVVISDDFLPHVGVPAEECTTIENWAVLDEIPVLPKENPWSVRHGLDKTKNLVYSGTIGMKHNPELLVRLAKDYRDRPDVRVVVITSDRSLAWLRNRAEEEKLENMVLLPFQPFADLPYVLASATIQLSILEPSAGVFSVPSKVLSYLCTKRPIVLAVPPKNLSARIVTGNDAGLCVEPLDEEGWSQAVASLIDDTERQERMGKNGRAYAEQTFDIVRIAEKFEALFEQVRRPAA